MRPHTGHGQRGRGPEGCGGTGATGCVGTGGEGGGPAREGGGVRMSGRNDSPLAEGVAPVGSGDGEREDFADCCCSCCRLPGIKHHLGYTT